MNAEAVYGTVLTAGLISAFSLYNPGLPVLMVKSRGVVSFRCSLWVGGGQAVR